MIAPQQTNTSFRDLIETMFRRKAIVFITVPLVLLAVLLWTLFTGKLYQSEMKLLVQNARGNVVISTEKTSASVSGDVTEEQINSELEVLRSHDVLDIVADPEWDQKPPSQRTPEEIAAHDKRLARFDSHLTTDTGRKSNVITISYLGKTPLESQDTLRRLAFAFLNKERRLERPAGASDFFVQEAERYRQAWNVAAQALVDFQQEHQLVALPDQEASLEKDITALETENRTMDTSLSELNGRLHSSSASLLHIPPRQTTERKIVPNQQSIQELNTLVVTLENKRTALLTQFKPTDRLVQEVDQQLQQTRIALVQASQTTATEETSDVNPAWQQLLTRSYQDQIARDALRQQHGAVAQQLKQMKEQLSKTQALTVQFDLLKSKADNLKENYQLYVQKRDQAQIEDAMDARQLLNVTIAESPTLSNVQVSPRPVRNLALGLFTALFLSFALVYVAELGRTTVITPRELEGASSYPVLATIPRLPHSRRGAPSEPMHDTLASSAALLEFLLDHIQEGRPV
jgi:uncharacterized protein involved in exopolysaccharide biosynthesis